MLGVSVSTLADYELGITKVIPVDKVVLMADVYNTPELKTWYCAKECPIGRGLPMPSCEVTTVERTAMQLLKQLRQDDVERVKDTLISITADGVISDDERVDLQTIISYLDRLIKAAGELRIIGIKVLNGGEDDG